MISISLKSYKPLILLGFFLVTWNEYSLEGHYKKNEEPLLFPTLEYYTVELSTHSIKLASQRDADIFIWGHERKGVPNDVWLRIDNEDHHVGSLIGDKSFNIKVEEVKEKP